MAKLVIDISHWDGDINLDEWKRKHDLWGVIIKAGGNERGLSRYADPKFERHYRVAKDAGLHIGYYYYTVSTDTDNAYDDARHFANIIGGKYCDLPCYMDVEDPGQFELSANALTKVITTFCDTLIECGYYAGLYISGSNWLNSVNTDELTKYANWIAWWQAEWPSAAGDIGMWQQGTMRLSDGDIRFADVSGYTDLDWCCVDYPSRINGGQQNQNPETIEENQNGSNVTYQGRASDVINAAYGELGYYAPDDPERGSKYGRWLAELTGEDWLAGPSWEIFWCCMFASWCLDQGGVEMDGFPTQNTDEALKGGARKYNIDNFTDVQYGDVIIFNWNWDDKTDHIGFATGEFDGYGFPTIEGNVGNAVQEKYRQLENVQYILRPPYDDYEVDNDNSPSVSTDPKNNRDGGSLDIDGIGGWNTIIDLQHQFGTYEDGEISGQDRNNQKYFSNIYNVTWEENGSLLVRAIQRKVGVDDDGIWGYDTSCGLQKWLIDHGYDCGNAGVDGYFGHDSVCGLQNALNDGAFYND